MSAGLLPAKPPKRGTNPRAEPYQKSLRDASAPRDGGSPRTGEQKGQAALDARKAQKKSQPKFRRQEWFRYRRLKRTGWRKPKGMQSSQRLNRKYRSPMARVGYGKIGSVRNLHPSGFQEVLVHRPEDLDGIDPAVQAARVGRTVGGRKRALIHERAHELGIRVLNRRRGV